jgi:chitobiase/beta-hexosaminidase-like protein/fibronectin type III domain protein
MSRKTIWLAASLLASSFAHAQTDVLVYRYDNSRTGQNLTETTLSTGNVNVGTFGKLYSFAVDGQIYGQPLLKTSLTIPGKGTFDVAYVTTQHGSVYALDANTATPLWRRAFFNNTNGITSRPADINSDIVPEISITSTPAIDPLAGIIYVVAETAQGGTADYYLYALDMTNGTDRHSPVRIQASVGSGAPPLILNASQSQQRPGLVLSNGVLYIAFGSNGDAYPWVGWVLGYDATTLARVSVFCTSGDGAQGAGLWSSGEAPPVDANGNLYVATGNGSYNGTSDWADSYLKLATSSGLAVADYFTPFNQAALANADLDLASAGITLLPDAVGSSAHPHLLIGAGKDGELYLIDRDNMGHYNGSYNNPNSQIVQYLPNALGTHPVTPGAGSLPYVENNYSTAASWQNRVYFCGIDDYCRAFGISNAVLSTSPTSLAPTTFAFPGAQPVISAASSTASSAILWAVERDSVSNLTILHAYDATNLATELYNSNQAASQRDRGGPPVKFAVPVVANGKVMVGADSELDVYGLLAASPARLATPALSPAAGTYSAGQTVTVSAAAGATIYYTLDGSQPTLSSAIYSSPIVLSHSPTSVHAIAVQSGAITSATANATYSLGSATPIAFVQENYATPQSAVTSVAVAFSSAQSAGDLNVVVVGWLNTSATVRSVTDSLGNGYTPVFASPTVQSGLFAQTIYYAKKIAGGSNTVTVAFNGAGTPADVRIAEYSGLDVNAPLDVSAAAPGSGTTSATPAVATTFENELLVGANMVQTGTTASGAGFSSRVITVPDADILEDRVVSATGAYAASASLSPTGAWIMQMAAFKGAVSGAAGARAPSAPGSLSVLANGANEIDLRWNPSTESGGSIAQYQIERCGGLSCKDFQQVGVSGTSTGYMDQLVVAGTPYHYRVRAVDAADVPGPFSRVSGAVTAVASMTAPGSLTGTQVSGTQVNLSWGAATETGGFVSLYRIERCAGSACTGWVQIGSATGLSFSDFAVLAGTTYRYRVRGVDSGDNAGPYSPAKTVATH